MAYGVVLPGLQVRFDSARCTFCSRHCSYLHPICLLDVALRPNVHEMSAENIRMTYFQTLWAAHPTLRKALFRRPLADWNDTISMA